MSEAAGPIEFWFDFSSPYGYFASREIDAVAARHGRTALWRPFLLGAVFKTTGMAALTDMPMRGDYALRDWQRLARHAGIPFRLPEEHPVAQVAASRVFYWVEATHPDQATDFARWTFDAYFAGGLDTSRPEVLGEVAHACGLDPEALLAGIGSQEIKDRLRAVTEEAVAKGAFGSPYFIVDGEPFWGQDRLPMLEEWLERGGW